MFHRLASMPYRYVTQPFLPPHCSVAFKWLKSAEIDFNPQGDVQQLQDITQFMAAKCQYKHSSYAVILLCLFSIAGTIFRSNGHSLQKLAEFIEVILSLELIATDIHC